MTLRLLGLLGPLFAGALLASASAHAASISSTFDTGADGWTSGELGTENNFDGVNHLPAGYIQQNDIAGTAVFFAPAKFLGNMSSFYGGRFSYDTADEAGNDGVAYPALVLYGAGQRISIASNPPSTSFTHFSFDLTEAGFVVDPGTGYAGTVAVSQAQFKAVLSDLTGVAVLIDWHTGNDTTDLDNVIMAGASSIPSPVPLPSSAPMFGAALVVVGAAGYRLRRPATSVKV